MKLCSSCGLNIPDDAKFCSWCGTSNETLVAVFPAIPATPVAAVPVTSKVSITVPAAISTTNPIAVPAIQLSGATQRRLRFCNRCGVRIPFGDARTYMGLVTCADCFDGENVLVSVPTIQVPNLAYAMQP